MDRGYVKRAPTLIHSESGVCTFIREVADRHIGVRGIDQPSGEHPGAAAMVTSLGALKEERFEAGGAVASHSNRS